MSILEERGARLRTFSKKKQPELELYELVCRCSEEDDDDDKKNATVAPAPASWDDLLALDAARRRWELWTPRRDRGLAAAFFGTRQSSVAPKSARRVDGARHASCVISTTGSLTYDAAESQV